MNDENQQTEGGSFQADNPLGMPRNLAGIRATVGAQAPEELRSFLRRHLQGILDKPLSPRSLLELEQTAALAHKLLVVAGDPRALPRRRDMGGFGSVGGLGMGGVVGPTDLDGPESEVMAPAPFSENFGGTALRELVATANAPKLSDLMRSLEIARKIGHADYERHIKAAIDSQLGIDADAEQKEDKAKP